MNLHPARWIWLPSQRTLASTFVLFRREVHLPERPAHATGWIAADLLLPAHAPCPLERLAPGHPLGLARYRLTAGEHRFQLPPSEP